MPGGHPRGQRVEHHRQRIVLAPLPQHHGRGCWQRSSHAVAVAAVAMATYLETLAARSSQLPGWGGSYPRRARI